MCSSLHLKSILNFEFQLKISIAEQNTNWEVYIKDVYVYYFNIISIHKNSEVIEMFHFRSEIIHQPNDVYHYLNTKPNSVNISMISKAYIG